jgi:hypothetical protein
MSGARPMMAPGQPIHYASKRKIGNNRQHGGNNERLERVDPAKDHKLIDDIDEHREDEDFAGRLPSLAQQFRPVFWPVNDGPQMRRASFARISYSRPNSQKSRNSRLEDEPESKRPFHATKELSSHISEHDRSWPAQWSDVPGLGVRKGKPAAACPLIGHFVNRSRGWLWTPQ